VLVHSLEHSVLLTHLTLQGERGETRVTFVPEFIEQ